MKNTAAAAPSLAGWPFSVALNVQPASAATRISARPLVSRWEYSMSVAVVGEGWTIVPLQSGQ
jgi:hypothetical protein